MQTALTFLSRLFATPVTQVLRGRLAPTRQQFDELIIRSGLPDVVQGVVRDVVKRTRLWRSECFEVAQELIAHFGDATERGRPVEEQLRAFGNVALAAKLIRRAKIRNRSLLWHTKRWLLRGVGVLMFCYVLLAIRFYTGHPTLSVDYVAMMNAATLAVPESDRAWPIYRENIRSMRTLIEGPAKQDAGWFDRLFQAHEGDPNFDELKAWTAQNPALFEQFSEGSRKKVLGFVYGPDGSIYEPGSPFDLTRPPTPTGESEADKLARTSTVSILLPYLSYTRQLADLVAADARVAFASGDCDRGMRRVDDLLHLATQHQAESILVSQLVGLGVRDRALQTFAEQLEKHPERLTDEQLQQFAHRIAGGRVPADIIDLSGERMFFPDILQRLYTDDGHGDGRPVAASVELLRMYSSPTTPPDTVNGLTRVAAPASLLLLASRKEMQAKYDELLDIVDRRMHRTWREARATRNVSVDELVTKIAASPVQRLRYLPIVILTPSLERLSLKAENNLTQRDGLLIAIACEVYRRQHGSFPATLDVLTPSLLPSVPADPIDGAPMRYRLVDGQPVVYSIGADGDDDGGHNPDPNAEGKVADPRQTWLDGSSHCDGDWILFPVQRKK
ncbi:MAG: hypothetical protein QM770_05925 [Tepidisphaeraceae bacterium]